MTPVKSVAPGDLLHGLLRRGVVRTLYSDSYIEDWDWMWKRIYFMPTSEQVLIDALHMYVDSLVQDRIGRTP